MRTQTFGVEIELTGFTRRKAAETVAEYFGTTAVHQSGDYDRYIVADSSGRKWSVVSDSSITVERRNNVTAEAVEFVTPILKYEDIETLQELIRRLRHAGAIANKSCGIHIHIGAAQHTPKSLRNLVNIFSSKQDIIYKALAVNNRREDYCRKLEEGLSINLCG